MLRLPWSLIKYHIYIYYIYIQYYIEYTLYYILCLLIQRYGHLEVVQSIEHIMMTFACTTRYCMNLFNHTDWFKTYIDGLAKWQSDATDLFCWDLSVAARSHFSLPSASTFMLEQMLIAKWVSCFGNVLSFTYILHHSFLNHLWFTPNSFLNMRSFSPISKIGQWSFSKKTWALFF